MQRNQSQVALLAIGLALASPALAQERISLGESKIVISDVNGQDGLVLFGDGSWIPTSPCPGILLHEPDTNLATLAIQACHPKLSLGAAGFPAGLTMHDGTFSDSIVFTAKEATGKLGRSGNSGILRVVDTDGLDTVHLDGQFGLLTLGSTEDDGDLVIVDAVPDQESFRVDGNTGNVTNQLGGNGILKAWAKINASGAVVECWRCDSNDTSKTGTGQYEVSFSPLGSNIDSRPRMAAIDSHGSNLAAAGFVTVGDGGDGVVVATRNTAGTLADLPFTVFIY